MSIQTKLTSNKTTTWETQCSRCGEMVHYHPVKLLLETDRPFDVDMTKRIVTVKCYDCGLNGDYEFPSVFEMLIKKTPAEIAGTSYVDRNFVGDTDSPIRKRYEEYFVAGWNERPVPTWKKMDDSIDFSQKVIYKMPNGEVTMLHNGHPHIKIAAGYMYVHELAVL